MEEEHYFVKLTNHNVLKLKGEKGKSLKVVEVIPPPIITTDYTPAFVLLAILIPLISIFKFIFGI